MLSKSVELFEGHVIHKKDEYEKKMEFYDESHEDGSGEKFGVYFESHGGKKGGHKKGGHKNGEFIWMGIAANVHFVVLIFSCLA